MVIPLGMALLSALIVGAIFGERGLIDLRRLQADQRRMERIAFQLQQDNARLREHIVRLRNDDGYLERWARQRLQWAKPGETIFRFDDLPGDRRPSSKAARLR